jgi:hypothetical protein
VPEDLLTDTRTRGRHEDHAQCRDARQGRVAANARAASRGGGTRTASGRSSYPGAGRAGGSSAAARPSPPPPHPLRVTAHDAARLRPPPHPQEHRARRRTPAAAAAPARAPRTTPRTPPPCHISRPIDCPEIPRPWLPRYAPAGTAHPGPQFSRECDRPGGMRTSLHGRRLHYEVFCPVMGVRSPLEEAEAAAWLVARRRSRGEAGVGRSSRSRRSPAGAGRAGAPARTASRRRSSRNRLRR